VFVKSAASCNKIDCVLMMSRIMYILILSIYMVNVSPCEIDNTLVWACHMFRFMTRHVSPVCGTVYKILWQCNLVPFSKFLLHMLNSDDFHITFLPGIQTYWQNVDFHCFIIYMLLWCWHTGSQSYIPKMLKNALFYSWVQICCNWIISLVI